MSTTVPSRPAVTAEPVLHRRAAALMVVDFALFILGLSFVSQTTLIPAFAERLGAPNLVIGAIPALMAVGYTLPAIVAANHAQGLTRRLPFILRWTMLERLPYLAVGLAALWLAPVAPGLTLVVLLAMLTISTMTSGLLMPAWLDLIGDVVPARARGRFFALGNGVGTLLGLIGSAGVAYLLETNGYPRGYALCFLVAFVCLGGSLIALMLVREPPSSSLPSRRPTGDYLRRLPRLVAADPNLARFLGARAFAICGQMAAGFFTAYALKELGAGDGQVGIFTAIVLASQTVGNLALGFLADRRGHLVVLAFGALASAAGSLIALGAGSVAALYPCFVTLGLSVAAGNVSSLAIGLELGPEDERPTYVAINNSTTAPFALIAPLIGGLLADGFGYGLLFALAAGLSLVAAAALYFGVRDPRVLRA